MPPIFVPVGGRLVRLERTVTLPVRQYDGWAVAGAFCAGVLAAILALAAIV